MEGHWVVLEVARDADFDPVHGSARVALIDGIAEEGEDLLTLREGAQEGGKPPHPILQDMALPYQLRLGQDDPPDPQVGEDPREAETGGAQADEVLHIIQLHQDTLQHLRREVHEGGHGEVCP